MSVERHVPTECELECVRVGCWGFQCSCPGHHGFRQSPHEHGRWYVNEQHHRAILDGAQRTVDRLGIEAASDYGDHRDELRGALDLIVALRLELAAQVRALPDREAIALIVRAALCGCRRSANVHGEGMGRRPDERYTQELVDAVFALFEGEVQR